MEESNGTVWSMEITTASTLQEAEEETIATVVIIVLAAAVVIAALFVLAVFIDCRQQKVHKSRLQKSKNVLKSIIPQLTKGEDRLEIVNHIQEEHSTNSDLPV
nr:uncharacterized protein LOC111426050 [Onthophagus taurus]